jgi:hypothetical protein
MVAFCLVRPQTTLPPIRPNPAILIALRHASPSLNATARAVRSVGFGPTEKDYQLASVLGRAVSLAGEGLTSLGVVIGVGVSARSQ